MDHAICNKRPCAAASRRSNFEYNLPYFSGAFRNLKGF